MFHGGIEVNGQEWSFGYCPTGTGVYCCRPKHNPMYTYRESLQLGSTKLTPHEVQDLIRRLKTVWQGHTYLLLQRNCCHFCEDFAKELGVEEVPGWLNRFAEASDATVTFFQSLWGNLRAVGSDLVTEFNNIKQNGSVPLLTRPPSSQALAEQAAGSPSTSAGGEGAGPSSAAGGPGQQQPKPAVAASHHQPEGAAGLVHHMFSSLPSHSAAGLPGQDGDPDALDTPPKDVSPAGTPALAN